MYKITISRHFFSPAEPGQDQAETINVVYAQSFEELDVAAVIFLLNKKTRVRGPRKKKEPKP